jgi:hypothetical protein
MAPKGQITTGKVFAWGIGLMLVALFIFGGPVQWLYETYAPDWARQRPADLPEDAKIVDLSVRIQMTLARDVSGTAIPIDVYDASMNPIESQSTDTTTGVATFQADYWEGETIYLQPYTAASSTTGVFYTLPLIEVTVPEGDVNGDAQLDQIMGYQVASTTAATFSVTDQSANTVSGTATNYINASSDASLRVTVVCGQTDAYYGLPFAFHDYRTGFDYLAGGWIVLTSNITQDMTGYDYYFEEGSTFYYVYSFDMITNDADVYSDGAITIVLSTGSTFSANDAAITIDVYDCMKLNSAGGVDSNSFKNYDTDMNPSVITTRVR